MNTTTQKPKPVPPILIEINQLDSPATELDQGFNPAVTNHRLKGFVAKVQVGLDPRTAQVIHETVIQRGDEEFAAFLQILEICKARAIQASMMKLPEPPASPEVPK